MRYLIVCIIFAISLQAQSPLNKLDCKCIEKINKDYGPEGLEGANKWWQFEESEPLRDKIFINLSSETPSIVSITTPYEYFPEGEVNEFKGIVIHRSGNMVMIKWENSTKNKIWIASINLELKQAIITESYDGITSFGMNIEVLECE